MRLKEKKNTASMFDEAEDIPLMEAEGIPVIFSDGAAAVEIHGDNVHVVYCELRTVAGIEVRVPVLRMIRPLRTCGRGDMLDLIDRARGGTPRRRH